MRVHEVNCGAMRPPGGVLMDGQTPGLGPAMLACRCLVLETDDGLVAVDTGTVGQDAQQSRAAHHPVFLQLDNLRLDPAESMAARVRGLGHKPEDVRHIVMTHLDFDHAAGVGDFPWASVHLSDTEAAAARARDGAKARARYRPDQWGSLTRWRPHGWAGQKWFGLPAAPVVAGVLLVWLPGHTAGHCGVAAQEDDGSWVLHAGDAVFFRRELGNQPSMPSGARAYQWAMEVSQRQRRASLRRLREVARNGAVRVVCTHDPAGVG